MTYLFKPWCVFLQKIRKSQRKMVILEIQKRSASILMNVSFLNDPRVYIGMLTFQYVRTAKLEVINVIEIFVNFWSDTNPAPCNLHKYPDTSVYMAAICHDKIPHIDGMKYFCECREYLEFRTSCGLSGRLNQRIDFDPKGLRNCSICEIERFVISKKWYWMCWHWWTTFA